MSELGVMVWTAIFVLAELSVCFFGLVWFRAHRRKGKLNDNVERRLMNGRKHWPT